MIERGYSLAVMDRARRKFRGADILKVTDRFTRGIPDIEILWLDTCSWIEMKLLRKKDRFKDILRMDQLVKCHQLGTVCGGRSYVAVFNEALDRTEVWLPNTLAAHVWPRVVGECQVDPRGLSPAEIDLANCCMHTMLIRHGMLWVQGWQPEFPVRIVWDAVRSKHGRQR